MDFLVPLPSLQAQVYAMLKVGEMHEHAGAHLVTRAWTSPFLHDFAAASVRKSMEGETRK